MNRHDWPSTGEPADSGATEALVAERFAEADRSRREWLDAFLAASRAQADWKRSKAKGGRRVRLVVCQ